MFVVSIRNPLDLFSKKQTVGCWNGSSWMEVSITGKSFSEALILTLTSPQIDKRLFIESPVQYMKNSKLRTCCVHRLFWISKQKQIVYTTCSELGIFMYWTGDSMNNLMSYCGLVNAKIRASDSYLRVN